MKSHAYTKKRVINIDYEKNKISWICYMPLLLIAGFVPLIVYGKYMNLTGTTQALFWTGQTELLDFFSYWKSRWLIALTAIALIIYIFLLISKKLPFKKEYKYYIPLGIYAFFVILSTIFAIDVPTALNGFIDMYQGMWVLLCYVTITFLVINYVNSERDIKLFLYAFIFLIVVEGLIGVGQYFGFDIFNTKFGNSLIIPSGVTVDGGLTFNFGKHTIYGTLFNTNYVGSFAALMLPMAVVFLVTAKTVKKRIIAGAALVLCVFTWLGCNSRAGYVGVAFSFLVAIIMLRKYVIKHWKIGISVLVIILVCFVGLNVVTNGVIVNRVKSLNVFKAIEQSKNIYNNDKAFKIHSIDIVDNIVDIKTTHENVKIAINDDKLYFMDENDKILQSKKIDNGNLIADIPNGIYIQVSIREDLPIFTISTPWSAKGVINFYISDSKISTLSNTGVLTDIICANYIKLFNGIESFMSGRGYIWSRSLPLLNKYMFVGAGPDNFVLVFPQNDYIAKMNINMPAYTVTDKPHNMYLQIGVNTGIISLIAFITLCGIYIAISFKILWKTNFSSTISKLSLGCFISIAGYLFAGIFNDNIVSVSPLFWSILGLGIATNIKIKKNEGRNV